MRRKDRQLSDEDALEIVDDCEYATISLIDDEGEIFSIPISIVREGMSIFIHGARSGMKSELLKDGRDVTMVCVSYNHVPQPSQAEFEAIKDDGRALGSKIFTTEYKSAILKTKVYEITGDERKIHALKILCEKYTPRYMSGFDTAIKASLDITRIYEFKIQSMSAKAKILH